jgi:hypothetical protein
MAPLEPTTMNFESIVRWRPADRVSTVGALLGRIWELPPPPHAAKIIAPPANARSLA